MLITEATNFDTIPMSQSSRTTFVEQVQKETHAWLFLVSERYKMLQGSIYYSLRYCKTITRRIKHRCSGAIILYLGTISSAIQTLAAVRCYCLLLPILSDIQIDLAPNAYQETPRCCVDKKFQLRFCSYSSSPHHEFITIERLSSRFEPKLQEAVSYSEKDGTDLPLDQ